MPDARPGLTPLRAPRRLFAVPGIIRILFCSPSVPFVHFVSLPLSLSLPNYDYFPIVLELELEPGGGGEEGRRIEEMLVACHSRQLLHGKTLEKL